MLITQAMLTPTHRASPTGRIDGRVDAAVNRAGMPTLADYLLALITDASLSRRDKRETTCVPSPVRRHGEGLHRILHVEPPHDC